MIKEDYVNFETAKLLKEKGFDWDCKQVYDLVRPQSCADGKMYDNFPDENPNACDELVSAPTLQMAMKWLREVYKIVIMIGPSMFWGKYNVSIYKRGNDYPYGFDGDSFCPSYEQACEVAIKYCLENFI